MSTQRIVWTALPNGYNESYEYLRLSVFLSPRLTPGPLEAKTLQTFTDFHSWPAHAISFEVTFYTPSGAITLAAEPDPAAPPLSPDLWKSLFPLSTPVRGYGFKPLDGLPIRSYHAMGVHDFLKGIYQVAATQHATDYPSVSGLGQLVGPLRYDPKRDENLREEVLSEPFLPEGEPFAPHKGFMRFQVFHSPFSAKQVPMALPDMEFHDIVGALARYPGLLRELGLVYDIRVPRVNRAPLADGRVRVTPLWEPEQPTEDARPWTHYTVGNGRSFETAPRPGGAPGYIGLKLPVGDSQRYGVMQLNVDDLSFKALHLAGNLAGLAKTPFAQPLSNYWLAKEQPAPPENTASLPSATTTGIAVVKNYRAAGLHPLLVTNTLHNTEIQSGSGDGMDLWLEDVVRGHRIDVLDEGIGVWRSLHRRVGTYRIDETEVTVARPEDEGWAMTGMTSPADPGAPPELRLHDAVAEWAGWSLSAPRPGSVIGTHDEIADGPEQPSSSNFRLKITFRPKEGSLPRLRFGRKYRLKVRSADLAGNGPALEEEGLDPTTVSPPIVYRRYEPVAQPVLVHRTEFKESESVEHLVVRTWTTPPADKPITEITERHVAPPVTTVQMAEFHGMLDLPTGGYRPDAYALLADREKPLPAGPVGESQLKIEYLVDPMARGAVFQGLPGAAGVRTVPFDSEPWPRYRPFRLKAVDGSGAPGWDSTDPGAYLVQLPPATVARVRMSSYPARAELEQQSGIWRWVMELYNPADPDTPPTGHMTYEGKVKEALEGRHWMVTPYREILLIHAVQQPLVAPKFMNMGVARGPGDTFATLRYTTPIDGKSTQKLDVHARWEQQSDHLAKDGPEKVAGEAHPFSTPIDPAETGNMVAVGRHEFGDTKHRMVTYDGTALTRFPEFYPTGTTPLTRTTTEAGGDITVDIPSSARPDVPDVLYIVPVFEWEEGRQSATRRGNTLRIYLNRPWYSSGDGEQLGIILNLRPRTGTWGEALAKELSWKYESLWGQDPILNSASVGPALQPANFALKAGEQDGLTLEEVDGGLCQVVAHDVKYDWNQKLWYCDVRISPAAGYPAYMPFVRLALVRYQPHSILNAHLSRVARADFAQLPADRSVSIAPTGQAGEYSVALSGQHAHVSHPAALGPWRRVEVQVERLSEGASELSWAPVGQPTSLQLLLLRQVPTYSGTVKVPPGAAGIQYRLVFREYEKLLADQNNRSADANTFKEVWRLIFAHAMPLTAGE